MGAVVSSTEGTDDGSDEGATVVGTKVGCCVGDFVIVVLGGAEGTSDGGLLGSLL